MITRTSLEHLRCLLLEVDAVGNILDATGGLDGVAGRSPEDFVDHHAFDFVASFDHELLAQVFLPPPEGIPMNRRATPFELTLVGEDGRLEQVDVLPTAFEDEGERRWIVSLTPKKLRSPAHRLLDVVVDGGDLRMLAERLVADWQVEVNDDPEQANLETFVVMDAGTDAASVVSFEPRPGVEAALLDEATHATFRERHREGVIDSALSEDLGGSFAAACAEAGLPAAHIGLARCDDGVAWWVVWMVDDPAFSLKLLNADIPRLAVLRVVRHALERDRIERGLRNAAFTDSLTGLVNHGRFIERIETTESADGDTVLFIDLDHFKDVNDTHGHDVGDAVLAEVGSRITAACREGDVAGRVGGDEFAVLLHGASAEDGRALCQRLHAAISRPIPTSAGPLAIEITIGLARSSEGGDLTDLVRRADLEMLAGKRERRR